MRKLIFSAHEDHPKAWAISADDGQQIFDGHYRQLLIQKSQIRADAVDCNEQCLGVLRLCNNDPAWLLFQEKVQAKAHSGL